MKNALEEEGGKERMKEIKSGLAREAERAGPYFLKASPGGKGPGHGSKQKGNSGFCLQIPANRLERGQREGKVRADLVP